MHKPAHLSIKQGLNWVILISPFCTASHFFFSAVFPVNVFRFALFSQDHFPINFYIFFSWQINTHRQQRQITIDDATQLLKLHIAGPFMMVRGPICSCHYDKVLVYDTAFVIWASSYKKRHYWICEYQIWIKIVYYRYSPTCFKQAPWDQQNVLA